MEKKVHLRKRKLFINNFQKRIYMNYLMWQRLINYKKVFFVTTFVLSLQTSWSQQIEKVAPGIYKVTYGTPEKIRPTDFKEQAAIKALQDMENINEPPIKLDEIKFRQTQKGVVAEMTMDTSERIYGFGLQVNSFEQRGMRRDIRTNSWVIGNVGFSHAPMPFYISSKGYGILINSSRYVTFYMGSQQALKQSIDIKESLKDEISNAVSPATLYNKNYKSSNDVQILVNGAQGMEIYIFAGPSIRNVLERYNLYSGGGAIPPLWGLGFKYRAKNTFNDKEVLRFTKYFRDNHIPCDMFGLEPGWQSSTYSCSYVWNKNNFPNPDSVLDIIHGMNYKLNLWEHAYVHPSSPIFDSIVPFSGNYAVWKGAVPDFITPQARNIFGNYHKRNFIDKNISAFKLDECDAAYYQEAGAEWSFSDIAQFPSGIDGEQMRQLFGLLYQKNIWEQYRKANKRTMLEVRASHLFAAPYGAAIYTDMYDHGDFVRMIANSGFAGVNWSPEVRETTSDGDLLRRLQTIVMSSHMVVDCWFLKNLPWFQYDKDKNNRDEFLPHFKELEQKAKKLIELRMSLIPYLYEAFAKYHFEGTPPFRALVMDYPADTAVWKTDNEYMMGESLLCAPFLNGTSTRDIYFPKGTTWFDFNTNKKYEGGKKYTITMSLDQIPLFVKDGTILPLAKPVEYITPQTVFEITCRIYGNPKMPARLFEDNSYTFDFEKGQYNQVDLVWNGKKGVVRRAGNYKNKLYKVVEWQQVIPSP